jgi:GNAT superfamily N-acetyltransferase
MALETSTLLLNEWSAQLVTRGGTALNVRPASPDDGEQVREFLDSLQPEDLRFRFLAAVRPSEALAQTLIRVDHRDTESLLAFEADGRLAASAMIAMEGAPEVAEVAVVVRSDLKNNGIGWTMLSHACDYARMRGFRRVDCMELSDNRTAIELEHRQGFKSLACPHDATLTVLSKDLAQTEEQ